jgi:predicted transposase
MVVVVKLVVQVKLLPSPAQAAALATTLAACNRAADYTSRVAFDRKVFSRNDVQKLVYGDLKSVGLGAQATVRTVKKVVDAYTALRANIRAGNLTSKRRVTAESKPVRFRPDAAQPFDARMFSCRRCGLAGPADHVAGINVRQRARSAWVFVNMPQPEAPRFRDDAAGHATPSGGTGLRAQPIRAG